MTDQTYEYVVPGFLVAGVGFLPGHLVILTHCTRITQLRGNSLRGIFFARALVVAMPSEKSVHLTR